MKKQLYIKPRAFISILFFVLSAVLLTACAPNLGGGSAAGTGGKYLKGSVAKGFPGLPLPEKAIPVESYGQDEEFGANFISDKNLTEVVTFFNQSLPALGWEVTPRQQSSTNYLFEIKNEKQLGEIIVNVASDGKKTAITMAVWPRK